MIIIRKHNCAALILFLLGALSSGPAVGAQDSSLTGPVIQTQRLPNGIEIAGNGVTLRVTALRDDVLRVRASQNRASVKTRPGPCSPRHAAKCSGYGGERRLQHQGASRQLRQQHATDGQRSLRPLFCSRTNARSSFTARPFRVYKTMAPDEHFFGLGDKVGPLDRRNQAFTDWNTDAYGWQESTDPIYKSIPFFLSWNQGRVLGVFFDNTWRASFDFGKESADAYSFGAPNGPVDYYLLYGPSPKAGGRGLRMADRPDAAAAALVARLSAIALQLLS